MNKERGVNADNPSTKPLRWGLLGTSRISRQVIPALTSSPRHEVVAAAGRDPGRLSAYAREFEIPRTYGSYDELLADHDVEVVYNPLPNSLHVEWTIRAARAGKHVLCEKPLALTVEDVDAVAAAAAEARVVVAEAFMYRSHPQTLAVKALVDEGAIGAVQLVRGAFSFTLDRPGDVRFDPVLGGGSLWDVGCYPVNYARYLLAAEPVEAFGWQVVGPTGIDLTFTGQLRFAAGALAQFDSSFALPFRAHIEVVGATGTISLARPFKPIGENEIVLTRGDAVESRPVPVQDLYGAEADDMADAIRRGGSPRVSLSDTRGNIAALLALLRSAREGRPVPIG
jgi:predicted dehydrogenase